MQSLQVGKPAQRAASLISYGWLILFMQIMPFKIRSAVNNWQSLHQTINEQQLFHVLLQQFLISYGLAFRLILSILAKKTPSQPFFTLFDVAFCG